MHEEPAPLLASQQADDIRLIYSLARVLPELAERTIVAGNNLSRIH